MSDGSSPPRRPSAKGVGVKGLGVPGIALGLAWLALVALTIFALVSARGYFDVQEARTPDLTGLPVAEATRVVEDQGLAMRSYPTSVASTAANTVTEQSPPAGTVVRRGRTISVGVNVPAEADRMPSVTGVSEADAVRTLRELSLPAPDVNYAFDERPAGLVVEQAPAPGTAMSRGDPVRLVVSRGEGPTRIELPDLTGLSVEDARTQLTVLGVRRIETVPVDVSGLRAGVVTQQEPSPGSTIAAAQPVTLGYALSADRVVRVPDVYAMEPWRARTTLRAAGLAIGPVETVHRDDVPEGVIETRPSGLTAVGAPVVMVVNAAPGVEIDLPTEDPTAGIGGDWGFGDGAGDDGDRGGSREGAGGDGLDALTAGGDERPVAGAGEERDGVVGDLGPGGRSVPFRFDPAALGVRSLVDRAYDLRLVVTDERGERTAIDRTVEAGEEVRATVVVYGNEPLLQTYVNGVFFQAWRP